MLSNLGGDRDQSAEDRARDLERQTREALDALMGGAQRLKALLPELLHMTSAATAQRTLAHIVQAASSAIPVPDLTAGPRGLASGSQRPPRARAGSGTVPNELRVIAGEAGATGIERPDMRAIAIARGIKPSSYRMAFAKLLEAGEFIERDGRIFSAEALANAGDGEERSEEPVPSAPPDMFNRSEERETDAAA